MFHHDDRPVGSQQPFRAAAAFLIGDSTGFDELELPQVK